MPDTTVSQVELESEHSESIKKKSSLGRPCTTESARNTTAATVEGHHSRAFETLNEKCPNSPNGH